MPLPRARCILSEPPTRPTASEARAQRCAGSEKESLSVRHSGEFRCRPQGRPCETWRAPQSGQRPGSTGKQRIRPPEPQDGATLRRDSQGIAGKVQPSSFSSFRPPGASHSDAGPDIVCGVLAAVKYGTADRCVSLSLRESARISLASRNQPKGARRLLKVEAAYI